jgi:hypothetical protein
MQQSQKIGLHNTGEIQTKNSFCLDVWIFDPKNSKPVKSNYKNEIQTIINRFFVLISKFFYLDFPDFRKKLGNPIKNEGKSKQKSSFFIQ